MIITHIEISKLNIPYEFPFKVAIGSMDGATNVMIKIVTDQGVVGWGEASPAAYITGDSQATCYAAAQELAPIIIGKDPRAIDARMAEINALTIGMPSIRSAFDMALYDIAAKAADMPLYRFLGGERREIRTDLTIGLQDTVDETVARAKQILNAGFNAIKLKVGRVGLEDVAHVKAVRELAGPDIAIKIDSNQGWDLPTAIANIKAMQPLDLEYSEQPLKAWDIAGYSELRRAVALPICADESVFDHHDALRLINANAADYLNIKLGKAGGIHTGLKINAIAEAAGKKCMIGCFCESRLGLAAAAHLAMARPNIYFLDLDSVFDFTRDPVISDMAYDETIGGLIHLSDAPGLGAAFDPACAEDTVVITQEVISKEVISDGVVQ